MDWRQTLAEKDPQQEPVDLPSFEQALKRLEEIVHGLEEGDGGLNEALQSYEEGVKLLRQSYDLLKKAERRIELLSGVDADGNPTTESFDDRATTSPGDRCGRGSRKAPTSGGDRSGGADSTQQDNDIDSPGGLF